MNQEVTTVETTKMPAVKLGVTKQAIAKLAKEFPADKVPDATTKDGYAAIQSALRVLVPTRTGIEKHRQQLVSGAVAWQKKVNTQAKDLTTQLEAIEKPYKDAKKTQDDKVAAEKKAAEEAEQRRVEEIEGKVADIEAMTDGLLGVDVATLEARLEQVDELEVTEEVYMEFLPAATMMRDNVKAQIEMALNGARQSAEQQKQLDEQKRESKLKESIQRIQMAPVDLIGKSADDMQAALDKLNDIDLSDYGTMVAEASTAIENTKTRLAAMIEQQVAFEKQQEETNRQQAAEQKEEANKKQIKENAEQKVALAAKESKEKEALEARLPEDRKLRKYADELSTVVVPFIDDVHLDSVREAAVNMLEQVVSYIYENTQDTKL